MGGMGVSLELVLELVFVGGSDAAVVFCVVVRVVVWGGDCEGVMVTITVTTTVVGWDPEPAPVEVDVLVIVMTPVGEGVTVEERTPGGFFC